MHTPAYYPNLVALCEYIGVEFEPLAKNSVSMIDAKGNTLIKYKNIDFGKMFNFPIINFGSHVFSWKFARFVYDFARFKYFGTK